MYSHDLSDASIEEIVISQPVINITLDSHRDAFIRIRPKEGYTEQIKI
jgi:hypothetical protein